VRLLLVILLCGKREIPSPPQEKKKNKQTKPFFVWASFAATPPTTKAKHLLSFTQTRK
jgi:hypothetical protein